MAETHCSLKRFGSTRVMLVVGIALVGWWLILTSARADASVSVQTRAGVLDLTAWPSESASAARLDGEWEFYWERLLDPAQFAANPPAPETFMQMPGGWRGQDHAGQKLPGQGFATLRLRVLIPEDSRTMFLQVPAIATAYRLWVNNTLVAEAGRVGSTAADSAAQYRPAFVQLNDLEGFLDIVLQVSNYEHRTGGMTQSLQLGSSAFAAYRSRMLQLQAAVLGGLIFFALHYLYLFRRGPREQTHLYFALISLLFALQLAVLRDLMLADLPSGWGWEFQRKVQFLAPLLILDLSIRIVTAFFPVESGRVPLRAISAGVGAATALVLVLPGRIYTLFQPVLLLVILASLVHMLQVSLRATLNGRQNGWTMLTFLLVSGFGTGAEIYRSLGGLALNHWMDALVWTSLPVLLTSMHVRSHAQVVKMQVNLLDQNQSLTAELKAQLAELKGARQLLASQEERRNRRIAEFLHSRVQTKLILAGHLIKQLKQLLLGMPEATGLADQVLERLEDVRQNDIRLASHQLHPAAVSVGLAAALSTLAAEYEQRLTVVLEVSPAVEELDNPEQNALPQLVRLTAYRAVAEALVNVVAHAEADTVRIGVFMDGGQLAVKVVDNGRGFDPATISPGLGLRTITARIAECDGTFSLHSQPGCGAELRFTIPIAQHGTHSPTDPPPVV